MNSNYLWLGAIIAVIAFGNLAAPRPGDPSPVATPTSAGTSPTYRPSDAERLEAHKILTPPSPPARENERRLAFYNDLRDHMDGNQYGVLEAVAAELRAAPANRVQAGYDLRTFYSAVGGDRDFKGGGDEDWPRLIAFSTAWLKEIPSSATARIARAQSKLAVHDTQGALADLNEASGLAPLDAWGSRQLSLASPAPVSATTGSPADRPSPSSSR